MRYAAILTALSLSIVTSSALADGLMTSPADSVRADSLQNADALQNALPVQNAVPLDQGETQKAVAEVVVLHGTNDGKGIDPSIGKLPQLKQPPFSSYDSYKLLKRSKMALTADKTSQLQLPDKGTFMLTLNGFKKNRYDLNASIKKSDGKIFLPNMKVNARAGDIFFIAGQKYKNGIMVLGIRVKPTK